MRKSFFNTLMCAALVSFMFSACESEQTPLTDNTKLWPAFTYNVQTDEMKYGFINKNGEWAIQPIYDGVTTFSNGVAVVAVYDESKGEYTYSYVDKKGNMKGSFADADQHYCGLARASFDGSNFGFVDASAEFKINPLYEEVNSFSDDLALYYDAINKDWGYLNTKGEVAIPAAKLAMYDALSSFSEGLARVRIDDKYGFIDKDSKQAISLIWDYAGSFSDGLAVYSMGSKFGFIDKKGEPKIVAMYDDVASFFENGLAPVEQNGKWGFVDKKGNMKIQPMFDDAYPFCEGRALVEINGKYGFVNTKGDIEIPVIYTDASAYFHNGLAMVSNETATSATYSYINKKGDVIWSLSITSDALENALSVKSVKANATKKALNDVKPSNHYALGALRK